MLTWIYYRGYGYVILEEIVRIFGVFAAYGNPSNNNINLYTVLSSGEGPINLERDQKVSYFYVILTLYCYINEIGRAHV